MREGTTPPPCAQPCQQQPARVSHPPQHLLPRAGLSPGHGCKPNHPLVKSSPFGRPVSSPGNLSKWEGRRKWGQWGNGGGMGQGTGTGHGTSPVIPGRFELIAGRGVSSHLTVLPWGFPFYENCCFWCDLL